MGHQVNLVVPSTKVRRGMDHHAVVAAKPEFGVVSQDDALKNAERVLADKHKERLSEEYARIVRKVVEVQHKAADAALSYVDLCIMIHKAQLLPKVARALLISGGMPDSRASELLSVAQASPRIFDDYCNRLIGFRAALAAARGEKRPLELDSISSDVKDTVSALLPKLLGDRKKFVAEIDGVKLMLVRAKPAKSKPAAKNNNKKKGKKS